MVLGSDTTPDVRMQQATINLFADMGIQPSNIQLPLVPAEKSTDTTPPVATVTSPTIVQYGKQTTIMGTATDSGGGVVGAVEVSVDGGQSWHPANGRETWSYTWTPSSLSGSATVMVRASDDSANLQTTPTSVIFTLTGGPECPCSLWRNFTEPNTPPNYDDRSSVELGMKFRSDIAGYITAVRFYKAPNNTGTHVGNLWTLDGKQLASVTFTNETPFGWQQASFSPPISINANTTYVISYYAPNGGYTGEAHFFNAGVDQFPLHALANGVDGANGVYTYATGGGFPDKAFHSTNYWVDIVFSTSDTPVEPTFNGHSIFLSWDISISLDISGYNVYRATSPGGAYQMLNSSPLVDTTYLDSDVVPGQSYYYVVTAVDRNNDESSYSNEATAVVPTP